MPPAAGLARSAGSLRHRQQGQVGWELDSGEGFCGHRSLVTRAPGAPTCHRPQALGRSPAALPILAAPLDEGPGLARLCLRAQDSRSVLGFLIRRRPQPQALGEPEWPAHLAGVRDPRGKAIRGREHRQGQRGAAPQRLPPGRLLDSPMPASSGARGPACLLTPGTSPAGELFLYCLERRGREWEWEWDWAAPPTLFPLPPAHTAGCQAAVLPGERVLLHHVAPGPLVLVGVPGGRGAVGAVTLPSAREVGIGAWDPLQGVLPPARSSLARCDGHRGLGPDPAWPFSLGKSL